MNRLKNLLANLFNGFLFGWFGGSVISDDIISEDKSVTNFEGLLSTSCIGILCLYIANLEKTKSSKKGTIISIMISIIIIIVEASFLSSSLQGEGLLYTKLYTGILGSAGGILVSILPLFLFILKHINPLINQFIKIIQEELPGVVRKLIRVILYSLGLQITQLLFGFLGLKLFDTLPPYTGLIGGALLGFNTPSSNELSLSEPDETGQKTD